MHAVAAAMSRCNVTRTSSLLYTQPHCPSQTSVGNSEEPFTDALGALGRQYIHAMSESLEKEQTVHMLLGVTTHSCVAAQLITSACRRQGIR